MKNLITILALSIGILAFPQVQKSNIETSYTHIKKETNLDFMGFPTTKDVKYNFHNKEKNNNTSSSTVLKVIPSPIPYIADIAFYNNLIWVVGYNEYYIWAINQENGNVVDSISIDIKRPYGICYNDNHFYILDNDNKKIEIINIESRTKTDEIDISTGINSYPTGVVCVGTDIYYNDPKGLYFDSSDEDITYNIDNSGNYINEYYLANEFPVGITFDNNFFWIINSYNEEINMVDPNSFETIKSINAPGGMYPNGLMYDGEYLWLANNESDSIYQIDPQTISTSINDNPNNSLLNIYPTLVNNQLNIEISELNIDNTSIEIINQSGQVVESFTIRNSYQWNINRNLQNGIYFCRLINDNNIITKKFILSR